MKCLTLRIKGVMSIMDSKAILTKDLLQLKSAEGPDYMSKLNFDNEEINSKYTEWKSKCTSLSAQDWWNKKLFLNSLLKDRKNDRLYDILLSKTEEVISNMEIKATSEVKPAMDAVVVDIGLATTKKNIDLSILNQVERDLKLVADDIAEYRSSASDDNKSNLKNSALRLMKSLKKLRN